MQEKKESVSEPTITDVFRNYWQLMTSYFTLALTMTEPVNVAPGVKKTHIGLSNVVMRTLYEVNPNPENSLAQVDFAYDIAPLLNELDQQAKGRSAYEIFNHLSDDVHLLADTSPQGQKLRGLLIYYLNDLDRIDKITREIIKDSIGSTKCLKIIPEKFIRDLIFKILMNVFFDSKELPKNTDDTMKLFTKISFSTSFSVFPQLSFFDKESQKAKKQYKNFCNDLIHIQAFSIYEIFQSEPFSPKTKGKNLFIDLLILKTKEKYHCLSKDDRALKCYLKNLDEQEIMHYLESMTAIPSILMLADNISTILMKGLEELRRPHLFNFWGMAAIKQLKPEALSRNQFPIIYRLRQECARKFPGKTGSDLTRSELRELEELDKFYHKTVSLHLAGNIIARHTEKEVHLKNKNTGEEVAIPARSTIVFELGAAAKHDYSSIFSVQGHKRKCPGSRVAETLFKTIVGEILIGQGHLILQDQEAPFSLMF